MTSINPRSWVPIDEDAPSPSPALRTRADALMAEWSRLHHEEEREQLAFDRDDPGQDHDPRNCDCDEGRDDDPDELCVHDRTAYTTQLESEALKEEGRALRMQLIEAELEHHGLRKARPYEHHNEDEAYYQYMEGRFGHYSE